MDNKKLSTNIKTDKIKQDIYDGQKKFLDAAGSVSLQTVPLVAAAPALIVGGALTGAAGGLGTNLLVSELSNNKYKT